MPRMLDIDGDGDKVPVATEEELLAFANKLRVAGGAAFLEALLPSTPSASETCLIANACNFGCSVEAEGWRTYADGSTSWLMNLESSMPSERVKAIAKAVNCPVRFEDHYGSKITARRYDILRDEGSSWVCVTIQLPKAIGNAAAAFDSGVAFQQYVV